MAEWFKAAVLKTVGSERGPGVRIPLSPPMLGDSSTREMLRQLITDMTAVRASRAASLFCAVMAGVSQTASAGQAPNEQAPPTFRARFDTSQGAFVIDVHREWAPLAADRFYTLVKSGFYDGARFFRVLSGFMAQFGLNGDPTRPGGMGDPRILIDEPAEAEQPARLRDVREGVEPELALHDGLHQLQGQQLSRRRRVCTVRSGCDGMDVVDKLYSGYGRQNVPDQRRIKSEGNAYLSAEYPEARLRQEGDDRTIEVASRVGAVVEVLRPVGRVAVRRTDDRPRRTGPPAALPASRSTPSRSSSERR